MSDETVYKGVIVLYRGSIYVNVLRQDTDFCFLFFSILVLMSKLNKNKDFIGITKTSSLPVILP